MKYIRNLLFAAALAAGVAPAEVPAWIFAFQGPSDADYSQGMKALDKSRWDEAVKAFDAVPADSPRRDAALYWKAYALNKLGRRADGLATIAELRKSFPNSRWINDAKALELEMGRPVAPGEPDEELKLMALNGLMQTDPERALPLLEKVLNGSYSPKLKERALFVLTQTDSPKAREIVASIARGGGNPDLQLKAIEYLGLFGGPASRQALSDIYASSNDRRVKRKILQSFMQAGERDRLVAVARREQDPDLRREAIRQLGLIGGAKELAEIYQTDTSPDSRKAVIEALFLSGDSARIAQLARDEKDEALRLEAIKRLGLMGDKTAPDLLALYSPNYGMAVRKQVIESLFLQGNVTALAEIARKETDPVLKRSAIQKLGLMGDRGGALASIYGSAGADQSARKAVIDAMFLQGNAKGLIEIARKETDPELKKEAVQKLSLMHSKEATDYMMEILK
jgi:HEAT repeat protein